MKIIKFKTFNSLPDVYKLLKKIGSFILIEEINLKLKNRTNMFPEVSVEMKVKDSKDVENYLVDNWNKIVGNIYSTNNFSYTSSNKFIPSSKDTSIPHGSTSAKDIPISLFGVKRKRKKS